MNSSFLIVEFDGVDALNNHSGNGLDVNGLVGDSGARRQRSREF